jgi:hypothetical protein
VAIGLVLGHARGRPAVAGRRIVAAIGSGSRDFPLLYGLTSSWQGSCVSRSPQAALLAWAERKFIHAPGLPSTPPPNRTANRRQRAYGVSSCPAIVPARLLRPAAAGAQRQRSPQRPQGGTLVEAHEGLLAAGAGGIVSAGVRRAEQCRLTEVRLLAARGLLIAHQQGGRRAAPNRAS